MWIGCLKGGRWVGGDGGEMGESYGVYRRGGISSIHPPTPQDAISSSEPWLIHFVDGPFKDLDLRKLPSLVHTAKVGGA